MNPVCVRIVIQIKKKTSKEKLELSEQKCLK